MKILAFDNALGHFGISFFEDLSLKSYMLADFSHFREPKRLFQIKQNIQQVIEKYNPDFIIMEDVFLGDNPKGYGSLSQLIGVLKVLCMENDIPFDLAMAGEWRKRLKIKGRSRDIYKNNTIIFVENKFNITMSNNLNDIADAIAIGWYACMTYTRDNKGKIIKLL